MPSKAGAAVASAGIMPLIVVGAGVALVVGLGGWLAVRGAKGLAADAFNTVIDTTSTIGAGFSGTDRREQISPTDQQRKESAQRIEAFDWSNWERLQSKSIFSIPSPVKQPEVSTRITDDQGFHIEEPPASGAYKFGRLFSCGSSPDSWKGAFNPFSMMCDIPSKFIRKDYYDGS